MYFVFGATHVVTEVKYGFNAFLVFKSISRKTLHKNIEEFGKNDIYCVH